MLLSCSTNSSTSSDPIIGGVIIGTSSVLLLKDKDGNNLIGTDKYPISGIYGEYLINGKIVKKIEYSPGVIPDNPNIVQVKTENNKTYAQAFLNSATSEEFPITYIHWNSTDTDTIKAQIKRIPNGGGMWLEKVWVFKNGDWEEQKAEITFIK